MGPPGCLILIPPAFARKWGNWATVTVGAGRPLTRLLIYPFPPERGIPEFKTLRFKSRGNLAKMVNGSWALGVPDANGHGKPTGKAAALLDGETYRAPSMQASSYRTRGRSRTLRVRAWASRSATLLGGDVSDYQPELRKRAVARCTS